MFRTAYSKHERYYVPNGTTTVKTYEHHINKYGAKKLEETGEENIYDKIQSYAEETKIENLINRVISGDISVLRPDGQFIDCTKMPKNMAEAQAMIQDMHNVWNGLPIDIRAKYNHSVEEFVAKSGQKSWLEDMGLLPIELPNEDTSAPITPVEKGEPLNES